MSLATRDATPIVPRPVHPFPARMAAAIPWEELSGGERELCVLDPMSGSGTTLVVARALGHKARGFDTDPLAVLLSRAWCSDVEPEVFRAKAKDVLTRATRRAATLRVADAYPSDADAETRSFVRYWFDQQNRRELTALSQAIAGVRDEGVRTLLWCAFSRLIIAKQAGASLALDLAHSRPHRVKGKATIVRPFKAFLDEVEKVIKASPFRQATAPPADVSCGDARALSLRDETVDVVITSPPYANGIDYQRTTKFSLVWMGHAVRALRAVRATNIGTEAAGRDLEAVGVYGRALSAMGRISALPERTRNILLRYVVDMDGALREISRVLVRGGRALLVVGDSTLRGVYVKNSRAVRVLAGAAGLRLLREKRRRLPPNRRYLPPPRSDRQGLDSRLRTETLLYFRKT